MKTIETYDKQTIYDLALQYYGNIEAVGEILALNRDLINDRKEDKDSDTRDFHFNLPIAEKSRVKVDEESPLVIKNITKELNYQPIITWQEIITTQEQ